MTDVLTRIRLIQIAVVLLAATWEAHSDERPPAPSLPLPSAESTPDVILVEPSDDPHPPPIRIGQPRPDGTGRSPGRMVEFKLTDQLGRTVTRETLLGRPWVANFIFSSCPTHCPATLAQLHELQRRLHATDVRFVTITVDPATDTVAKMAELARAFGADPDRWLFLTGDLAEIHKVIVEGFQQPMVTNPMLLAHSLNLMHVDASGTIVGKYRYHYLEGESELNLLRQVLLGQIETPEENRFLPREAEEVLADAAGTDHAAPGESSPNQQLPPPDASVPGEASAWVHRLRTTNAMLNGLATVLLLVGLAAIKARQVGLHKRTMLLAFATSVAFLACYLTYHGALKHFTGIGHKPYTGAESLAGVYRAVLWSHIVLAAMVPVLAILTIRRGLKEQWEAHRRLAKVTFPIWMYVSVTGVLIYFLNV